jgi:organic hydroperoxide reductase OsmC/OhrA
MKAQHNYKLTVKWTRNKGSGTSTYTAYERNQSVSIEGKPDILGSSDPVFRGDKTRHNPEEFLVAAISSCHMLSYLHLCADAGIVVVDYIDNANGLMIETKNGSGRFTEVTLHPVVVVADESMIELANMLHEG